MSVDPIRHLKSLGRDLTGVDSFTIEKSRVPERVCLAICSPKNLLDTSAYNDAYKAGKMYSRADFSFFFLASPSYPNFNDWMVFFLTNVKDHFALVLSGFPVKPVDGIKTESEPFKVKGREILPKRIFSLINKNKNPASRVTILVNGCPSVETWSNDDIKTQTMSFTLTSAQKDFLDVLPFKGAVPERVLLMTICPRLDCEDVSDRGKGNTSTYIKEVSKMTKNDPVLSAEDIFNVLQKQLRKEGQQLVLYSSSTDVTTMPFLL